jgi:conjugal transfer pilus assembly protein TraK
MTQNPLKKILLQVFHLNFLVSAILSLTMSFESHAAQRVEVRDNATSMAQISSTETTRIKVDGAAIIDVVGNVYHKEKNQSGEIAVDEDKARGEIFISLVKAQTKPVNLFIVTAQATYTLLLHPADIPSDTIVLVDRTRRNATTSIPPTSPGSVQAIRALMSAMSTDRASTVIRVTETNRDVPFRSNVRFTLMRQFEAGDLTGERYLLTNTGARTISLTEQEFYTLGVLAVAVERTALHPNETTTVYVVKQSVESTR